MSLVKDELNQVPGAVRRWQFAAPSHVSDHGETCCQTAREWFLAMDSTYRRSGFPLAGLSWIGKEYTWGPSEWPVYWCEIPDLDILDCGALTDVTCAVLTRRGVESFPAQVILQFTRQDVFHWSRHWFQKSGYTSWIQGTLVYHEVCAVLEDDQRVKIWNPSDGCWLYPSEQRGYGSVAAVRISTPREDSGRLFTWDGVEVSANEWKIVADADE